MRSALHFGRDMDDHKGRPYIHIELTAMVGDMDADKGRPYIHIGLTARRF